MTKDEKTHPQLDIEPGGLLHKSMLLEDGVEEARKTTRRYGRLAVFVTLGFPLTFLFEALVFWGLDWPDFGPAGLMLLAMLAWWFWWVWSVSRRNAERLAEELRVVSRSLESTGSVGSISLTAETAKSESAQAQP